MLSRIIKLFWINVGRGKNQPIDDIIVQEDSGQISDKAHGSGDEVPVSKRPREASGSEDDSESSDFRHRSRKSRKITKNGRVLATKYGMKKATKNGSKAVKKSKNGNHNSDSDCHQDSESDHFEMNSMSESRSVFSETVSSMTYNDTGYRRFNPHKKEKTGVRLSAEMKSFIEDNFNKYIATNVVQDLILKTMPVPSYDIFNVRTVDPVIYSILEEQRRFFNKSFDKAFISIQNRIISTMGPITQLWKL